MNDAETIELPDQAGLAAAARNQAPVRAMAEDNKRVRNAHDGFFGRFFARMPSLKQVALGVGVSFLSYKMSEKYIPEFLSHYCPPYSDSVASWHPCYGFPTQGNLNQLATFKLEIGQFIPPRFPLIDSLVTTGRFIEDPSMYYGDSARSVDCGEGKTACYAFLPKVSALIKFPQGVNCVTYNTSCYENWGNNSQALRYYQGLESRLQQQEQKLSKLTFNLPNGREHYASRAGNDFVTKIENIKNLYRASRLTASAKKEASLAFIARQMRTTLTHDQADKLPNGALVISGHSQKVRAALHGEKAQYDQAMSSWNKAREAYEQGLAAAPKYSKGEWFSKEDWRHYLQDLTYRMTELQYWQSHTLQRILEDDLRRIKQLGSKKISDLNALYTQNEATRSQFSETIRDCYQLVSTITDSDQYSPYRVETMMARSSVGNITTLNAGQLYKVIAQRVKLLCDTFQQSLQENQKKNQQSIEVLKTSKQDSEDSQAF